MNNGVLDFDNLQPQEIPVKIQGKTYVLKEATGGAATIYRNAQIACSSYSRDGNLASVKNLADTEPLLVSLCLFERVEGQPDRPVSAQRIKLWPARVQKKLFEEAQRISELRETASEERKQLQKALAEQGSPVEFEALREYVNSAGDQYKELKEWFKPLPEESAKNGQIATGSTSELVTN